jgi:hypothetical protein
VTRASADGSISLRKYDSSQSTSGDDITCEDTDPPITGEHFPVGTRSHPLGRLPQH